MASLHGQQIFKSKLPAIGPKLQIASPTPRQKKKIRQKTQKSDQKTLENPDKNHSKIIKITKKTKNAKSKIKVSKSLANPNTNQMLKQIQSKCKENHRNSKNQHF